MEWNGDQLWWQDGVQLLQVQVVEPPSTSSPAAPAAAAAGVSSPGARTAKPAAAADQATPVSKQAASVNKKYMTDPPASRQPWFEFLPLQASIKPTLRPKHPCSQKNIASADKQAAREQQTAEARAARYMGQAAMLPSHNHHHTLQLGPAGATPQEHLVLGEKGKHRPQCSRSGYLFDPITSTSRPVTAPSRTASRSGLLSLHKGSILHGSLIATAAAAAAAAGGVDEDTGDVSAASQRDCSGGGGADGSSSGHETLFFAGSLYHTCNGELISLQRRPGSSCGSAGRYNPLTHTWAEPPSDAAAYERWQREGEATSRIITSRRRSSAEGFNSSGSSGGSGSCRRVWAGKDTVGSLLRQQGSGAGSEGLQDTGRAVRSGDTWRVCLYGPVLSSTLLAWQLQQILSPAPLTVVATSVAACAVLLHSVGATPVLTQFAEWVCLRACRRGTYDLLRHEWVVPPADARYANRQMGPGALRVEPVPSAGGLKPMRKAVTPPSTGVYDPIRAEWKVLPQQRRAAYSLDFAPTKLFEEKAFVKRK